VRTAPIHFARRVDEGDDRGNSRRPGPGCCASPRVEIEAAQRATLTRELDADGFGIPNAAELAEAA